MVYQFWQKLMNFQGSHQESAKSLPLYLQLSEYLIREILAGRLADGDKLPAERQMAVHYGTTVTTLRKALDILADKQMLKRIHGSGNYVRAKPSVNSVYSMFRLELLSGGGLPTAQVMDVAQMVKPDTLPAFGTSDSATRVRRLRKINDAAIAIEEIWLDKDAGQIEASSLQDSLYRYYRQHLGFWISRAEDRVSVAACPAWSPGDFGVQSGAMAGFVTRYSWGQSAKAVEFSRTWFDPNVVHYVHRLI